MTNAQLYLSIGIPSVLIFVGIILNQVQLGEVNRRLGVLESDLREFYRSIGKLEGRMDAVEKR